MQFNTPYGLADDQSASYFCGLQEGLAIGGIAGVAEDGSGIGVKEAFTGTEATLCELIPNYPKTYKTFEIAEWEGHDNIGEWYITLTELQNLLLQSVTEQGLVAEKYGSTSPDYEGLCGVKILLKNGASVVIGALCASMYKPRFPDDPSKRDNANILNLRYLKFRSDGTSAGDYYVPLTHDGTNHKWSWRVVDFGFPTGCFYMCPNSTENRPYCASIIDINSQIFAASFFTINGNGVYDNSWNKLQIKTPYHSATGLDTTKINYYYNLFLNIDMILNNPMYANMPIEKPYYTLDDTTYYVDNAFTSLCYGDNDYNTGTFNYYNSIMIRDPSTKEIHSFAIFGLFGSGTVDTVTYFHLANTGYKLP